MKSKEINFVTVNGRNLVAAYCVCPICHALHLNMTFDTTGNPWKGTCPKGHTWDIPEEAKYPVA